MRTSQRTLGLLLLVLVCTLPTLVAAVVAQPTVYRISDSSSSQVSVDRSDWLPIVPPEPHTVEGAEDPTAAVAYNVSSGEVVQFSSTHPTQQPVQLGLSSTQPYEGLLPSEVNPETVFPPDDRSLVAYSTTTTYPWRTICKIYITAADGTKWIGSASIIGPGQAGHGYHILTAGHCIYIHDHGGWVSSVEVIPGYDGAQGQAFQRTPYYHAWVTYMRTYTGWTVDKDHRHDWAVCTLDRNVGDYTGWMGRMTASSSNPVYTGVLNTAGYPGDLSSGLRMYFDSDNGRTANEYNHWYYMDTYGGQSGSPVWHYDGTNRYILTVHAYGDDGSGSNHGTRLNQDKFDRITTWTSSDTPPTDKADLTDRGQSYSAFSPTTVRAGNQSFSVWCDVHNFGTESSGGFYVRYYASTNTVISPSDHLIGTDYVSSISPFNYADSSWSGIFPSGIPAGTYWVGWIIDATGVVSEFDETNNIEYKDSYQLTVLPPIYKMTFYTDPSTVGSITFAGTTYTHGQTGQYVAGSYAVTANPPSGWVFSNWVTTGGVSISGSTATVTGTGTIKAVFKAKITFYTEPSTVGSITFAGTTYTNGQTGNYAPGSYTVTANPPSGWVFTGFTTTGGVSISGSTATVTGPGTIKALFKAKITFYTDPSTVGSITFSGTTYTNGQTGNYAPGSYNVTANAPSGWVFSSWVTTGGVTISGSTATVTGPGTVKAVFTEIVSFKIWTDKTVYHVGETMKVYVRVKNLGPALPARAVIYLRLIDGTLYGPLLDMTVTIPANFDSGDVLWQSFTIPSAPLGNYTWLAGLLNPSTGAVITYSTWPWQLLA